MPLSSTYVWFLQALNVMNAALELHRNSLSLKPLLSTAEAELEGRNLTVAIVEDQRPSRSVDYVTIRFQQGQFVLVSHARMIPRTDWRVSSSYLMDVARNPRHYLDGPDRLDLDWLRRLLGMPAHDQSGADAPFSVGVDQQ